MPNQRDMDEKRPAGGSHSGKEEQGGRTEKSGKTEKGSQASQRGEDREMKRDHEGRSGNRQKVSADR
jgi:hypothetical protein